MQYYRIAWDESVASAKNGAMVGSLGTKLMMPSIFVAVVAATKDAFFFAVVHACFFLLLYFLISRTFLRTYDRYTSYIAVIAPPF